MQRALRTALNSLSQQMRQFLHERQKLRQRTSQTVLQTNLRNDLYCVTTEEKRSAAAEFLPLLLYAAAGQSAACFT